MPSPHQYSSFICVKFYGSWFYTYGNIAIQCWWNFLVEVNIAKMVIKMFIHASFFTMWEIATNWLIHTKKHYYLVHDTTFFYLSVKIVSKSCISKILKIQGLTTMNCIWWWVCLFFFYFVVIARRTILVSRMGSFFSIWTGGCDLMGVFVNRLK